MKEVTVRFEAFKMIEFSMFVTEEQYQEMQETNSCHAVEKAIDRNLPRGMRFGESCSVYDPETKGYILEW